jgi:PAS domain S-box-containing protein
MDNQLRVLLVEDDEGDAAVVLRWLKRAGYTVTSERGDTAAEMSAMLDRGPWDVILCDHDMPQWSSLEALGLLRDRGMDLPFVLVSGNIGEEVVVNAMKAGAQDFVSKRDLSRLGTAIERARREVAERQERRRAEEALRKSEERFVLAVEAMRDGVWDLDLTTDQIYCSPRFCEMLGLEAHDLQSLEAFRRLIDEKERERMGAALKDHLERRVPFDVEFRVCTEQGEERWFRSRGQAVWDKVTGKAARIVGALSDLSALKRTEAELRGQIETIRRQQEAIRVLSVPIVEVWDGVLTVPVVGAFDRERAEEMMRTLLAAVSNARCRYVIIDVTGVASMDAAIAEHAIRIARAVQLLGATSIVVGIQPEVAMAIVSLGIDLSSIMTLANLREALVLCMRRERGAALALR